MVIRYRGVGGYIIWNMRLGILYDTDVYCPYLFVLSYPKTVDYSFETRTYKFSFESIVLDFQPPTRHVATTNYKLAKGWIRFITARINFHNILVYSNSINLPIPRQSCPLEQKILFSLRDSINIIHHDVYPVYYIIIYIIRYDSRYYCVGQFFFNFRVTRRTSFARYGRTLIHPHSLPSSSIQLIHKVPTYIYTGTQ